VPKSITPQEAAKRARPRTLYEVLSDLDAVPSYFRDLCMMCGEWFDRPWSADLDTCPRCMADDQRRAADLEGDLKEAHAKLDVLEDIENEQIETEAARVKQKDRADDLVKVIEDVVEVLENARTALALPDDAPHDDPRRALLGDLDEAVARCHEAT